MRVALDTNRLTDLLRNDGDIADLINGCELVFLPFIVLAEINVGIVGGSRQTENQALLTAFLAKQNAEILYATRATIDHYARIAVQLKKAGTPIPTNDIWIAALCLEHDLTLLTRDRHFDHLPQLLKIGT